MVRISSSRAGREGGELVPLGELARFVAGKRLSCWGFSPLVCGRSLSRSLNTCRLLEDHGRLIPLLPYIVGLIISSVAARDENKPG